MLSLFTRTGSETITTTENLSLSYQTHHLTLQDNYYDSPPNYTDLTAPPEYFSTNKNICVVGIFENSNDKKMLFESSNCKIYQNYDRNFIFNEIKSVF